MQVAHGPGGPERSTLRYRPRRHLTREHRRHPRKGPLTMHRPCRKAGPAWLLCTLLVVTPAPALAQPVPGQFLLISDLHFDPFYDGALFERLNTRPVEDWAAILEESQPAGFNPKGTDSNYALLKSSLDDARARNPTPDFILYPGDFMAHQWQDKYDRLAGQSRSRDPR